MDYPPETTNTLQKLLDASSALSDVQDRVEWLGSASGLLRGIDPHGHFIGSQGPYSRFASETGWFRPQDRDLTDSLQIAASFTAGRGVLEAILRDRPAPDPSISDSPILPTRKYDIFLSYAAGDSQIAEELRGDLQKAGLTCFMASKDIEVSADWQESIRKGLCASKRVLVLLTPRSISRPWVLMESGAAWALGKPLVPALSQIDPAQLIDPIRRHQARPIETT